MVMIHYLLKIFQKSYQSVPCNVDTTLYGMVHVFGKPMKLKWFDLYVQDAENSELAKDALTI